MAAAQHHRIVIVGGGSAGISVASRMLRAGEKDVAVIDPADAHYYQPLWTLVGGGRAPVSKSARSQVSVMPKTATWIKDGASAIDPDAQTVDLASGASVSYDYLVVCPGIALDWDRLPGSAGRSGATGYRATTKSSWHPRRGSSSGICAGERRCSRCLPGP